MRRKKWYRIREFNSYDKFIQIESPNKSDCIIDASIGGWKIAFCEHGFLCVWAVSLKGELYFRKGVCHTNVEGTEWMRIRLPEKVGGVLKCSCNPTGNLVLVTYEGIIADF